MFQSVSPQRFLILMLVVLMVVHMLLAGRLALSVDEAHYALYGFFPDWSYFDHPPMVGWLQAMMLKISDSEFSLRFVAILLSTLSGWLLYRLSRQLFPSDSPWVAVVAVILMQSAVIWQLISFAMVPEIPLLVVALVSAMLLYRIFYQQGGAVDWLLLGLCLGLAGLSKYTAITLVISALLMMLIQGRWRVLLSPWPWLAMGLALILITPVLYWNMQHEWISFLYQLGHGAPETAWSIQRFLRSQGAQLLVYGPGVFILGLFIAFHLLRGRREDGESALLMLALPVLLLFGWMAGYEETLPHWPLLAWVLLSPLIARWLVHGWNSRLVRGWAWGSAVYAVLMVSVLFSQIVYAWIPFRDYQHPFGDFIGWQQAAERGRELSAENAGGGDAMPLLVGNWSIASRIAWYARPLPVVVTDKRYDQFDLWYGSPDERLEGILIVPDYYSGRGKVSGLAKFDTCELLDETLALENGRPVHSFRFYHCRGYQGA